MKRLTKAQKDPALERAVTRYFREANKHQAAVMARWLKDLLWLLKHPVQRTTGRQAAPKQA